MRLICLVAMCWVVAACNPTPPPPVVVYAPADVEAALADWFAGSGFAVTIVSGESAALTDKVINKQDLPQADVLLTAGVFDVWRAGDRGALRPIQGSAFENVPAVLKDPDKTWAAYGYHRLAIATGRDANSPRARSYRDLGAAGLAGKLCLSSSELPVNQMLVGMLVEDQGVKPAERLVRSWVRNLAQAPFADQDELVAALQRGDCAFGIVSSRADLSSLSVTSTSPAYVDIDGVGISRHAPHPENAQQFVDWILSDNRPAEPGGSVVANVGLAGWHAEEARLLVERAGYR